MNITTTCNDRKTMAKGLAVHLGCDCAYLSTPTFAYRVGNLQVERDGSITGERADLEAAAGWLLENGYISELLFAEDATAEEPATDEQPAEEETEKEQPVDTEDPATDEDSQAPADQPNTHTCLNISLGEFTPQSLTNLLRMLYARQHLIRAMTQSEGVEIAHEVMTTLQSPDANSMEILEHILRESIDHGFIRGLDLDGNRHSLAFLLDEEQPTRWPYYTKLLIAMVDKAKAATRVGATLVEPEEMAMKYFCRGFLLQLGLGGAECKELRSVLLNHLPGYAAFRTAEKMDAHKAKYAELRRQQRELDSEAHEEVREEAHEEVGDHEKG